jgi:xylulose-5-phosphate/fructose-6-phosphate phosphoketolase
LPIVSSQLDQHLKFLKQSSEIGWRPDVHALNILSTSCWQRQDHNGYTHQNPSLISSVLSKPSNLANCFFPVDDVAAAAAWEFMSESKNVVNLTTFNKNPQPRWIDIGHARYQLGDGHGCSIYRFASDDDPDLVVTAIGDIPTAEALEAIKIVKSLEPSVKIRFVGIAALSYAAIGTTKNKLLPHDFDDIFLRHKPIVINFHGYQETIRAIFTHYANPLRLSIHGYEDQGSTTSPIDELARNHASRYDIAADILERTGHYNHTGSLEDMIIQNARHAQNTSLDK